MIDLAARQGNVDVTVAFTDREGQRSVTVFRDCPTGMVGIAQADAAGGFGVHSLEWGGSRCIPVNLIALLRQLMQAHGSGAVGAAFTVAAQTFGIPDAELEARGADLERRRASYGECEETDG